LTHSSNDVDQAFADHQQQGDRDKKKQDFHGLCHLGCRGLLLCQAAEAKAAGSRTEQQAGV
jgi:hypothetical protein